MEKIYNKLVRDKIEDIIKQEGERPKTRILEKPEKIRELLRKLEEEVKEIISAKENMPELAKEIGDALEVIDAIIEECGLDKVEVLKMKAERKEKRGGFSRGLFLESVDN